MMNVLESQQVKIALFPNNNRLSDNGYSIKEESEIYDDNLDDVLKRPRWYLDNLDNMQTYRVSWHNYKDMRRTTLPHKYCKKRIPL